MKKRVKGIIAGSMAICIVMAGGCGSSSKSGGVNDKADKVADAGNKKEETANTNVDVDVELEKQVIVDQDGVKIEVTGIGAGEEKNEFYLDIEATNDTDKIYDISKSTAVNGYNVFGTLEDEKGEDLEALLPGKVSGRIHISGEILQYLDIGKVGKIEFQDVKIREVEEKTREEGQVYYEYKNDQFDNPFFQADYITIETDAVGEMEEAALPEGEELYNENGIRLVKTNPENAENPCGVFFLQNMSEDEISLLSYEVCINDMMANIEGISNGINIQWLKPGHTEAATYAAFPLVREMIGLDENEEIQSVEWVFRLVRILPETDDSWEFEETIAEFPYTYSPE